MIKIVWKYENFKDEQLLYFWTKMIIDQVNSVSQKKVKIISDIYHKHSLLPQINYRPPMIIYKKVEYLEES